MLNKKNLDFFFSTLARMYPDSRTELDRKTPRQLLVAVVLSAQTTDKQVNKVSHGAELRGIHDGSSSHRIV